MSTANPSPNNRPPILDTVITEEKEVYIYAEVDIDKAFHDILAKSKKIRAYLQEKSLSMDFTEKMRNYKNFVYSFHMQRICFDNEIQKFIHHKELTSDLRLIKKNVFNSLQDFIIQRFHLYLQEESLHAEYKRKVDEIEKKFSKRFQQLMKKAA